MFEILISLGAAVMAIIALNQISTLDRKVFKLKRELSLLTEALAKGAPAVAATAEVPEVEAPAAVAEPTAKIETPVDEPVAPTPEVAPVVLASTGAAPEKRDVEKTLASRWFVWIGGVAVALAGLLFIKYAHDNGLIPPALRVVIGLLIAAVLVAGGEYVRRARPEGVKDYVPQALSAAGLVMAFGVIYAAYGLYGLVGPTFDFIGLAVVALSAFWLSRLQGPFTAALGLIGSYAAPALVATDSPSAWGFFPYLIAIVAASFVTLRGRNWWWLGYAAIAGAFAWALLWIAGAPFSQGDVLPIGIFALALGLVASLAVEGRAIFAEASGSLIAPQNMSHALRLSVVGIAAAALILSAQVFETHHGSAALIWFVIGMALVSAFSWFKQGWSIAALLAAGFTLVVFMGWPDVAFHDLAMDERGMWTSVPGLFEPPIFVKWMLAALAGFVAYGAVGFLRKDSAQPWSPLVAGAGLLFLFGAWARADFVMSANSWALLGVVISAVMLALVWMKRSAIDAVEETYALSGLVIAAGLLGLYVLDRWFDDIWLTIAIAALALGYAWLSKVLPVRLIGAVASGAGSFAAIRLFAAREIWREVTTLPWGQHWVIYGYGVPAVLLFIGSRLLANDKYRRWSVALEGISLALVISLVSLELRVLIGGGIVHTDITLLEMSAHILAWLGAAYGLAYRQQLFSSLVSLWGSRVLLVASCVGIVSLSLILLNPLVSGDAVEGNLVFNALTMAYLAPVVLLALIAQKMEALGLERWRNGIGVLALVLAVAYVTLQTKMMFQGKYLIPEFSSDAESYTLSAVWLVLAIGLFVLGLVIARKNIRLGGMVVLVLALLKVFGYDLWEIGGLWRIASLLGLGLCLIGVGWLYTRYIQTPKDQAAA